MNQTVQLALHSVGLAEHPDRAMGKPRSPHWSTFEKHLVAERKVCAATGLKIKLQGHHIIPFSYDSSKELDPKNVIILTALADGFGDFNAHLLLGHKGSFKLFNPRVEQDAADFLAWIRRRYATIQDAVAAGELPKLFASDNPVKIR